MNIGKFLLRAPLLQYTGHESEAFKQDRRHKGHQVAKHESEHNVQILQPKIELAGSRMQPYVFAQLQNEKGELRHTHSKIAFASSMHRAHECLGLHCRVAVAGVGARSIRRGQQGLSLGVSCGAGAGADDGGSSTV
jgi:hypothetical protein